MVLHRYSSARVALLSLCILASRYVTDASLFGVRSTATKPALSSTNRPGSDLVVDGTRKHRQRILSAPLTLRGGASSSNDDKIVGPCIGIDLGTTYSCVAVWKNNRVDICPNEQGHRITPSYVAFCKDGTRLIGDAAKNQGPSNPTGTFFDVKRLIGRKFQDATVQKDKTLFPFEVSKDKSAKPLLKLDADLKAKHSKSEFTPEEISGMVLRKMKETGK